MRRYIVVEGSIGVGKSTLCRVMRDAWGAHLVMEPDSINPFLEPYYRDPERFAFPVQMFYLITRWRQQQTIRQLDLFHELVVADYLWLKDRMFAEKTLPPTELELYDHFSNALGETAPVPDLLVYLQAPLDVLMERIHHRGAPGEDRIEEAYVVDLLERYERMLAAWDRSPILRIDNRDMDYSRDPDGRDRVLSLIQSALAGHADRSVDLGPPGSSLLDREGQPGLFPAQPELFSKRSARTS